MLDPLHAFERLLDGDENRAFDILGRTAPVGHLDYHRAPAQGRGDLERRAEDRHVYTAGEDRQHQEIGGYAVIGEPANHGLLGASVGGVRWVPGGSFVLPAPLTGMSGITSTFVPSGA